MMSDEVLTWRTLRSGLLEWLLMHLLLRTDHGDLRRGTRWALALLLHGSREGILGGIKGDDGFGAGQNLECVLIPHFRRPFYLLSLRTYTHRAGFVGHLFHM